MLDVVLLLTSLVLYLLVNAAGPSGQGTLSALRPLTSARPVLPLGRWSLQTPQNSELALKASFQDAKLFPTASTPVLTKEQQTIGNFATEVCLALAGRAQSYSHLRLPSG